MWRFALSIFNFGAAKISICHPLKLLHCLGQTGAEYESSAMSTNTDMMDCDEYPDAQ